MHVHLIAIGGTGMAPLACLLDELGHSVTGSDKPLYPPMSELLAEAGIVPLVGFDPAHLAPPPDLVVVGNAVPRDNPEARETERLGLERVSMPEALYRFFMSDRRRLVIAGTHGKTTTTSMAAWALTDAGLDPGYLIGGVPQDLGKSFHRGAGRQFVVEGDEYNAAYFDRGPKFLHYRPHTLVLTSAEYDHADLYPTPEALEDAYGELVSRLPGDGLLLACGDSDGVAGIAARAPCRLVSYGLGETNDVRPEGPLAADARGTRCRVVSGDGATAELALPMTGRHNLTNALAVWAATVAEGVDPQRAAETLGRFHGVQRRQQVVGEAGGVTVVDDFAHHPTAVAATLAALAQRFPGHRVVALFEPRSLTAGRGFFRDAYLRAFAGAGAVILAPVFYRQRFSDEECLDVVGLARDLTAAGVPTVSASSYDDVLARAAATLRPGDVAVTMSSGSFEGMPRRLVAALGEPA